MEIFEGDFTEMCAKKLFIYSVGSNLGHIEHVHFSKYPKVISLNLKSNTEEEFFYTFFLCNCFAGSVQLRQAAALQVIKCNPIQCRFTHIKYS